MELEEGVDIGFGNQLEPGAKIAIRVTGVFRTTIHLRNLS